MMHTKVITTYYPIVYLSSDVTSYLNIRECSKNPHFQNEAKCTTLLVKMSFICIRMKNHFHMKG